MNYYLSFFVVTMFLVYSSQDCYNNCQNLGVCVENTCWCNDGTSGGDCSNIKCPTGVNYGDDKVKECSGRGKCVKGVCQCNTGFTGLSCEKFNCPFVQSKSCCGHGQCMALTSLWGDDDLNAKGKELKNRVYGCVCGKGYSGYACTYKECSLGRYDKHALNDDDDQAGDKKRYKDYARDVFQPQKITSENCTITIENCERDNQFHCKNKTILVSYKDSAKTLKNRIVGSGILTDLIVTYVGTDDTPAYGFENTFKTFGDAVEAVKKDPSSGTYKYSVEFYYIFDPYAKIINDETKKESTSCIKFSSTDTINPSHSQAGNEGKDNAVVPLYKTCSGLGGCNDDSSCTCQAASDNTYDLDTLGFGRKQKKLYNCLPKKGQDPMKETIDTTTIKGGFVKKEGDIPFSYLVCPESKNGIRCTEQTCANYHGYSWFNYPSRYETTQDKYLPPMLCSGEGVCDSSETNGKGICLCNNGFIGSTCQTLDCPSKYCNGHGKCEYHTMGKLGLNVGECNCDNGYSGNDCSERTCPKSLDLDVEIIYTFGGSSLTTGSLKMTNAADSSKDYKTWTDITKVTIKDLLTELEKFGKFSYTLSVDSPPLTPDKLIKDITTDTKLTLTGIKVEDSKNFPNFTLTDEATPSNTLTTSLTKSNGYTLTVDGSSAWSGKLTMEESGNILYEWKDVAKVTIGDLLEKLEIYLQLKFNTDKDLDTKLSKLTTLTNPPETTDKSGEIKLTDSASNTITITKPSVSLALSWSVCSGYGNCDKNKGQCNCFKNYYGKYCNYKMRN